jgi:predicted phage terminase large subunit-like protein
LTAHSPRVREAAARLLAYREGAESLLRYQQLRFPDPDDPDNYEKTTYETTPQAWLLCQVIEKAARGELPRVAISIGPQLGKSEITSRGAPAWLSGNDPRRNILLGSYNTDLATDFGAEVKAIVESPIHKNIFPEYRLRGAGADHIVTSKNGKMFFLGVGGAGTGKSADFFIVDDPIKNDEAANSPAFREKLWKWYNSVVFSRTKRRTVIIIVHTRWNEDDLIGRLCDPEHPERNGKYAGLADRWRYINLPAVVKDTRLAKTLGLELKVPTDPQVISMFGTDPMCALWENEKPLELLAEAKQSDAETFSALYMGSPTPEEGSYFKSKDLMTYSREDEPDWSTLRRYGASDHAVSTRQERDFTVLGCAGIDHHDNMYIHPDLVWERMETDKTVDEFIRLLRVTKPGMWWIEDELISRSFGPFLYKRMREERIYVPIDKIRPLKDKRTVARSIQGRLQQHKVFLPKFAPWYQRARTEMLRFDKGTNDDFVSFLSMLGQGLMKEMAGAAPAEEVAEHPIGSIQDILARAKAHAERVKRKESAVGW